MPIYLGNTEINTEYVDSYGLGNIFLGTNLIQGGNEPYDPFIRATGGTITTNGDYKIHTFDTVGTSSFDILQLGTVINNSIEYLVVAGGGAGGFQTNGQGRGGGAGGLLSGSYTPLSTGSNSIIVGAGGVGTTVFNCPDSGSNSSALGFLAYGGGSGRGGNTCTGNRNGGSGAGNGITLDAAQGFDGGTTNVPGGGGAGQVGQDGSSSTPLYAGNGGNGKQSSITGTSTYYAGGGGGGGVGGDFQDRLPGTGGLGGGGNGGGPGGTGAQRSGKDATYYGSGGGGAGDIRGAVETTYSGDGAQGVVILRYKYK
jgi:hypothetical protein